MGIRSLVLLSFAVAAFSLATPARADVPTGSTTSSTSAGTGGSAASCTVAVQSIAGTTCMECNPTTSACSGLGSDYNYVCTASTTSDIYCNGPDRLTAPGNNLASGCAVSMPSGAWGGGAAGVLVAAAALLMRRRRRA